jgi:uncharacterized membrane protein
MPHFPVMAGGAGYVQAIDAHGLVGLAQEHGVIVEMMRRPGHFVIPTSEIALVAGSSEDDDRLGERIRDHVVLGPKRTATQDVEFSITLLVEIAARALSPGVNDFYTAIACVDHLTAALGLALERGLPSNLLHDDLGRLRVELHPLMFQNLADTAFHPLRQDACANVAVSIRLLESLAMLAAGAPTAVERNVLARHGRLITVDALRATSNAKDRRDIEARSAALQSAVDPEPGSDR